MNDLLAVNMVINHLLATLNHFISHLLSLFHLPWLITIYTIYSLLLSLLTSVDKAKIIKPLMSLNAHNQLLSLLTV